MNSCPHFLRRFVALLLVLSCVNTLSRPARGQGAVNDLDRELARLKRERHLFHEQRDTTRRSMNSLDSLDADMAVQLREELRELLDRLALGRLAPNAVEKAGSFPRLSRPVLGRTPIDPKLPIITTGSPVDAFALGRTLFRMGRYEESLKAFRMVDEDELSAKNRSILNYLVASSLRRQGVIDGNEDLIVEAESIYSQVANETGVAPRLKEYAQWQLQAIKWRRDSLATLEKFRAARDELNIPDIVE